MAKKKSATSNILRMRFPRSTNVKEAMKLFSEGIAIAKRYDLPFFSDRVRKARADLFVPQRLLGKIEQVALSFSSEEIRDSRIYINKYMNLLVTMEETIDSSKPTKNMDVLADMNEYFLKNGYLTAKQIKYAKYLMGKIKPTRMALTAIKMGTINDTVRSFINPAYREKSFPDVLEEVKVSKKIQEPLKSQEMQFIPKKKDLNKVR